MAKLNVDARLDKFQKKFVSLGRKIDEVEKEILRDQSLLKHMDRHKLGTARKYFHDAQASLGNGIERLWQAIGRKETKEPVREKSKQGNLFS